MGLRKLQSIRAYKLSLAFPIVMPVPLVILTALVKGFLTSIGYEPIGENLVFLGIASVWASIIAFIPYVALVTFLVLWMKWKTEKQVRWILVFSPLLFVPIFLAFATLFYTLKAGTTPTLKNLVASIVGFVPLLLGFGYFYVTISFATIYLLRKIGIVYEGYD